MQGRGDRTAWSQSLTVPPINCFHHAFSCAAGGSPPIRTLCLAPCHVTGHHVIYHSILVGLIPRSLLRGVYYSTEVLRRDGRSSEGGGRLANCSGAIDRRPLHRVHRIGQVEGCCTRPSVGWLLPTSDPAISPCKRKGRAQPGQVGRTAYLSTVFAWLSTASGQLSTYH
jgi:hypothetical protein